MEVIYIIIFFSKQNKNTVNMVNSFLQQHEFFNKTDSLGNCAHLMYIVIKEKAKQLWVSYIYITFKVVVM